jgi:hypothetical protein
VYLSLILTIAACSAPERRLIKNPDMNQWNATKRRYVNLFQPQYGYLEETESDQIEFRKPHEMGTRKYAILYDPRGDIDRSKGYDASEYTVSPELDLIHNPTHDVQITWIRHATFLIQLGKKYQILVDPVLAQVDGMTGVLMKFVDFAELHAEPPITIQELPLGADSIEGNPQKKNIVAISHDHYDHLNFNTLKQLPENTLYYVPLGLETEFPRRYLDVTNMDWYTKDALDDLTIYFLPANHRSGRSLYEMNQTLCNTLLIKCDLKISNSASSKWEKQLKFRTTDVS